MPTESPSQPPARDRIIAQASEWLDADARVLAAWLGGSDASGRVDRWSDVDLVVAARDESVEAVLTELEIELGPHARRTRFAQPTFHGHEQVILLPADAPEHCLVDLVVMKGSTPPERRLLEPERHGRPVVLVDRVRFLEPLPELDIAELERTIAPRVPELRDRFHLFRTLVTRAVDRGHGAEAADRHLRFVVAPLIELARIIHCPERHAFGPRYLDRDLPASLRARIDALVTWDDVAAIRGRVEDATTLFRELEATWDAGAARPIGSGPRVGAS